MNFQLMQVYQTSTDRKDWNATRPHRLTRVITAAIGTQMGYLLGNPFGHRVIATPFQSERSQSSETSSRSKAHRRKRSKRDSHRRHADERDNSRRSRDNHKSRYDRSSRSRRHSSHDKAQRP